MVLDGMSLTEKIQMLKVLLKDVIPEEEKLASDMYLYHWMRANKYTVKNAEKAIRESLKWRKENQIKELAERDADEKLESRVPCFIDVKGKGDIPVAYHSGAMDIADALEEFGKKRLLLHIAQKFAKQENLVHAFDKTWTGSVEDLPPARAIGCYIILDMEGYSMKQNFSFKVLQFMADYAKMVVQNFPAAGHLVVVINATKLVEIPLQLVKPILKPCVDVEVHSKDEDCLAVVSGVLEPRQLIHFQDRAGVIVGKNA